MTDRWSWSGDSHYMRMDKAVDKNVSGLCLGELLYAVARQVSRQETASIISARGGAWGWRRPLIVAHVRLNKQNPFSFNSSGAEELVSPKYSTPDARG